MAARPSPETVFGNTKFAIFIWCPADPTSQPQAGDAGRAHSVGRGRASGNSILEGATHIPQSQRETNCRYIVVASL